MGALHQKLDPESASIAAGAGEEVRETELSLFRIGIKPSWTEPPPFIGANGHASSARYGAFTSVFRQVPRRLPAILRRP